jgi:6-phosphogluconolactonase
MGKVDLVEFQSADLLADTAAQEWLDTLPATGPHYAAFSGGRIAEKFFDAITTRARARRVSLAQVHFFWADERCVPPDDPGSNYLLMRTRLLQPLNISEAHAHRIKGELEPAAAAREASIELLEVANGLLHSVFLGMGEDGHIASIFPGDRLTESSTEHYRAVFESPKPPPRRVTLAMHAMVAARNACVMVSGPGKAETLGKSLNGCTTPLGRLLESRHFTKVLSDIGWK